MMTKYRLIISIGTTAALFFLATFFPAVSSATNSVLSGVRDGLVESRFLLTDSLATQRIKNTQLRRLLAESYAHNILLLQDSSFDMVSSDVDQKSTAKITGTPFFDFIGPAKYTIDQNNALSGQYVSSGRYILGIASGPDRFRTFQNDDLLQAKINQGLLVDITVENRFTYSIDLPKAIKPPEGLIGVSAPNHLIGILIEEQSLNETTNRAFYQLPFQPTLSQSVDFIDPVKIELVQQEGAE